MATKPCILGKCMTMCPRKEFEFRKLHKLLHPLEMHICDSNTKNSIELIDIRHCIKEFHRSAAGETVCKEDDLRPSSVLINTIDYLFTNILFQPRPFSVIYNFVFDRLRSIRQDAVIQRLEHTDPFSLMNILEKCVRFYLYAAYRCQDDNSLNIDVHINMMHTKECLRSLIELYCETAKELSDDQKYRCMLMTATYIALNINSTETVDNVLRKYSTNMRKCFLISTTLEMHFAHTKCNVIRFNKLISLLVQNKSYSPMFAVLTIMPRMRFECIRMLCHSHNSKNCKFSVADLRQWLLLKNDSDVISYCKSFGLSVNNTYVVLTKTNFNDNFTNAVTRGCYLFETLNSLHNTHLLNYLLCG